VSRAALEGPRGPAAKWKEKEVVGVYLLIKWRIKPASWDAGEAARGHYENYAFSVAIIDNHNHES